MSFWLFVIRAEIARFSVPGSLHKEEEAGTIFLLAGLGLGYKYKVHFSPYKWLLYVF